MNPGLASKGFSFNLSLSGFVPESPHCMKVGAHSRLKCCIVGVCGGPGCVEAPCGCLHCPAVTCYGGMG